MESKRSYCIGGLHFAFSGWLPTPQEGDYLPRFASEGGEPNASIHVKRVSDIDYPAGLIPEWEEAYIRSCRIGDEIHRYFRRQQKTNGGDYGHLFYSAAAPQQRELFLCDRGFALTEKQLLTCIGSEELFLHLGAAVLHSSCVEYDGQAILFSGASGIGKSTQAALWQQAGASIKNGDRNLLRCKDGVEFSCGLPYAGSSGICENYTLPIRAIVFLGQAEENRICKISGKEAALLLLSQLPVPKWDAAAIQRAVDTALRLSEHLPIYRFRCLPNDSAVDFLKTTLAKDG